MVYKLPEREGRSAVKAYIAGPMTGKDYFNLPAFFAAEEKLVAAGYDVVNPGRNTGCDTWSTAYLDHTDHPLPWEEYLKRDLTTLLTCDMLVTLPGWHDSRGANLEVYVARELRMPVLDLETALIVGLIEEVAVAREDV